MDAALGRAGLFDGAVGPLARHASEAILLIDDRQSIVALNPAAGALLGCEGDEVLGQSLDRFLPPDARAAHRGHVRSFAASGVFERAMAGQRRVQAMRADGRTLWVEITISRVDLRTADGPRRYYAALLREVGDEASVRGEIDQLRQRLRAIFDLAPSAIWIVDHATVVFANMAAARLFGTSSATELIGHSVFSLLHPGSHAELRQEMERALAAPAATHRLHAHLASAARPTQEVEVVLAALPDHEGSTLQMVVADVTQSRAEARAIESQRQMLRQLSARLVEAREEERRRISRELHDELGQRLTALKMDLGSLARVKQLAATDPSVAAMNQMIDETLASVRRIAGDLRPLMLDDLGLNAAIEWLGNEATRRLGIDIELALDDVEPTVDERVSIALYRMVQEALTNVARHAQATRVRIELHALGDHLELVVHDNGRGFGKRAIHRAGAYGLIGMRERAQMLGGSLRIYSPPEGGARITVQVPRAAPETLSSTPPLSDPEEGS